MYPRQKYKDTSEKPWSELKDPAATQKYDGASFYLEIQNDGTPKFYSRRMSVHGHYPERSDQLPHLVNKKVPELAGHVYGVELIHTGHNEHAKESNVALSGILNSLPARSKQTQENTGVVRAVLLDVINPQLPTYKDKLEHLKKVEGLFGKPQVIFAPPYVTSKHDIVKLIDSTRKEGKEGVIVTSLSTPEPLNVRVKVKHFYTFNLRVVRVIQEFDNAGHPKNSMGALECEDSTGRVVSMVGTGFSKELRAEVWKSPRTWIGKLISVKTMGLAAPGGKLRAPVFNGDADGQIDKVS